MLKGITGTGKTFTIANVIAGLNQPALIIAPNKTLAAQLWGEMKELFPDNAVEFFVSYYDFYQPEAYIPQRDLLIEKDARINVEIERLRHSVMASLLERTDVIVVASVSALYPMSDPEDFYQKSLFLTTDDSRTTVSRNGLIRKLVDMHYRRNDIDLLPGTFQVTGGTILIYPVGFSERALRLSFFGEELEEMVLFDTVTGQAQKCLDSILIFAASQFVAMGGSIERAEAPILAELETRCEELIGEGNYEAAERLRRKTLYDLEQLKTTGNCPGIENYAVYLQNRERGSRCYNLLDYFPEQFIVVLDESHLTVNQIRAMHLGDYSRKKNLIDYGFRLPSCLENRPPTLEQFEERVPSMICMSATPGRYEMEKCSITVTQEIRPTGLLDPIIDVRPKQLVIDQLMELINDRVIRSERVLVTVLTKRQAEELSAYIEQAGYRAACLHSGVDTVDREHILRRLQDGELDVVAGINLLREGLDLPEVSLVAILDADREGFLRSASSLLQLIGRAARNANGRVVMFADRITPAMKLAIEETAQRRARQSEFNRLHGITPRTMVKDRKESIASVLAQYSD